MSERKNLAHMRDETVPVVHIRHVGPVLRCICGRDYVAGYHCPGPATSPPPNLSTTEGDD